MVEIGTWKTTSSSATPGSASFKVEGEEPPGRHPCRRCNKVHIGPCEKIHWKRLKPKPGEPTTKIVDGKTWYYCLRCNRWNPTHVTADHRSRAEAAAADGGQANIIEDDSSSLGTDDQSTSGSAHFASYAMRNLRRSSRTSFASTVRNGVNRARR